MTTLSHPWISRQATSNIYAEICKKPAGVNIYLIKAPAGVGKTYLARDIGTKLGSETGYGPGHREDIYWSGIVDLYDPDTSNGHHIESSWKQAFSSAYNIEFREYDIERARYVEKSREGTLGAEIDNQLKAVRNSFADGMQKISQVCYPVMAFDTVERLRTVLDPTQEKLDIQDVDAPDVFEWLFYQIERLTRGVVLMMGRPASGLEENLNVKVETINLQRKAKGLLPVNFIPIALEYLTNTEMETFFNLRIGHSPELKPLLTNDLKALLCIRSHGNPLLLDIALQTLLETKNSRQVHVALENVKANNKQEMQLVEDALLSVYMNSGSIEVQLLLNNLVIARNGLFDSLLEYLNPDSAGSAKLHKELERIGELPFVKVRDIAVLKPGQEQRESRHTYFLHDAMYDICDRVNLVSVAQMRAGSQEIVKWYDNQIELHISSSSSEKDYLHNDAITDLLVESLPYRMRSDPQGSYDWYLEQFDKAIRGIARGRDARLRDAMAQFLGSAGEKGKTGILPANIIDGEILGISNAKVHEDFKIDSALQWIKRYSIWGKHDKALEIAEKAVWVKSVYETNHERYLIRYSEFRLWQGQSFMYLGKSSSRALELHNEALNDIEKRFPFEEMKKKVGTKKISQEIAKICFVIGRLRNNRGYIYWMYLGKYWMAIEEFLAAINYFEYSHLVEETANSLDNIGRVYTILGINYSAFESIREGLKLRIEAGLEYREGLSRNSLAIAFAQFENIQLALQESETALKIFRAFRIERGIALARITHGVALRIKSEQWRDIGLKAEDCVKDLEEAEADLLDALQTFTYTSKEPIRQVQASNELACCYRTLYMLRKTQDSDTLIKEAFRQGKNYFDLAIVTAVNYGFLIEQLDSQQDRAVLYTRAGQFEEAKKDMEIIRNSIPENHRILERTGLMSQGADTRIDAYYKLMGQVEFLAGTVKYNEAFQNSGALPNQEIVLDMLEHYVLTIAYFNAFSGGSYTNRQTNHRIYARLRGYSRDFLVELRDNKIPDYLKKYNLPSEVVRDQFDEVFGLLIPGSRLQNWEKFSRH
jgi:tetratricopeptide (TPR) repeat protein